MGHGFRERYLVTAQDGVLDKRLVVLLVYRHEHTHYVAHQVCAAFGHTVQENRADQPFLRKVCVLLVEVVRFGDDSRH